MRLLETWGKPVDNLAMKCVPNVSLSITRWMDDLNNAPAQSGHNQVIDTVTHNFLPDGQATLYPVKLFGIMSLFERCP